jgi:pimeloyl-ACP methyl ester carboxylesterase
MTGLSAPLHLADEGVMTVGGRIVTTEHPGVSPITGDPGPGHLIVGHMYVHYRVPVDAHRHPIVMIHGSNGTGASFETTPDGREGWATWFVRRGHPVYVVDHAGRGRSGFDPTPINAVRAGVAHAEAPNVFLGTAERLWVNTRVGPRFREPFAGTRFPVEAFDQFLALHVPNTESTLVGGGENTIAGVTDLLDRLGQAIVMVHSQGGLYGVEIARRRPDRVRALVSVEGGSQSVTAADVERGLGRVPFLSVWGDNSHGAAGVNGDERREGCLRAVQLLTAGGGMAELMMLPDMGISGNTHAMMADTNNLEIADLVGGWLDRCE